MDEEEHEVYGGEIPDEGEMEGDNADVDMTNPDDDAVKVRVSFFFFCFFGVFGGSEWFFFNRIKSQELDEMKKRLKEMEEEAAALREMQAKVEKEMGAVQGPFRLFIDFLWCFFCSF